MLLHLGLLVLLGWFLFGLAGGLSWTALQVAVIAAVVAVLGEVVLTRIARRDPLLT